MCSAEEGIPLVSVVIPTYNRAHLLPAAIESVRRQTFRDLEIIVVDDASADDTDAVVHGIGDRRVRYFRHDENRGGGAARNTGIARARGAYIAFLDSDDRWLSEKLALQLKRFEGAPQSLGVVYTAFRKANWRRQPVVAEDPGNLTHRLLVRNVVGSTSTPLIRTDCLKQCGGFDETLPSCQDWDLWIRLSGKWRFDYIPTPLVSYHHQSVSISMNRRAVVEGHRTITRKYREQLRTLPSKGQSGHYFNAGKAFFWKRSAWDCLRAFARCLIKYPPAWCDILKFLVLRPALKRLGKGEAYDDARL